MPKMIEAAVSVEPGRIELDARPIPEIGPTDARLRVTALCPGGKERRRRQRDDELKVAITP